MSALVSICGRSLNWMHAKASESNRWFVDHFAEVVLPQKVNRIIVPVFYKFWTKEVKTEFVDKQVSNMFNFFHEQYFNRLHLSLNERRAFLRKIIERDASRFCSNVQDLILSEEETEECIEILMEKNINSLARGFKNFSLSNEKRKDYALRILEKAPEALSDLADSFEKIPFSNEELKEYAAILLEKAPKTLAYIIQKIPFSKEELKKCAESLLEKEPEALAANIKKFLLSKEDLAEYAVKLLEVVPKAVIENIKQFLSSKEDLAKYAAKLLKKAPEVLASNLEVFPLSEEELKRYFDELVKIVPGTLFDKIDRLPIMIKWMKQDIADLIIKAPREFVRNIQKLASSDEELRIYIEVLKREKLLYLFSETNSLNNLNLSKEDKIEIIKHSFLRENNLCFPNFYFNNIISYFWWFKSEKFLKDSKSHVEYSNIPSILDFLINACGLYSNRFDLVNLFQHMLNTFNNNENHLLTPLLVRFILLNGKNFSVIKDMMGKLEKMNVNKKLQSLIYSILFLDVDNDIKERLIAEITDRKTIFKDTRNSEILMRLISNISFMDKKELILSQIFEDKNKDEISRIRFIQALIDLHKEEHIAKEEFLSFENILEIFKKSFFEQMDIQQNAENLKLIDKMLRDKSIDPAGLLVYFGKINSLQNREEKAMLQQFFKKLLMASLQGNYKNLQGQSPHLKRLAELGIEKDVLDRWQQDQISDFFTIESKNKIEPKNLRFKKFLKERLIEQGHLANLAEKFPRLHAYLKGNETIEIKISKESSSDERLEHQLISACKNEGFSNWPRLSLLLKGCENSETFMQDIEEFNKTLTVSNESPSSRYHFTSSSSLQDLMRLGRETGGCQNIDGTPDLNKALLGICRW